MEPTKPFVAPELGFDASAGDAAGVPWDGNDAPSDPGWTQNGPSPAATARPLRVHEAAFVLGMPESKVRKALAQGELARVYSGTHLRVVTSSVYAQIPRESLADLALEAVVAGRLHAPRAPRPSLKPPRLSSVAGLLWRRGGPADG